MRDAYPGTNLRIVSACYLHGWMDGQAAIKPAESVHVDEPDTLPAMVTDILNGMGYAVGVNVSLQILSQQIYMNHIPV